MKRNECIRGKGGNGYGEMGAKSSENMTSACQKISEFIETVKGSSTSVSVLVIIY